MSYHIHNNEEFEYKAEMKQLLHLIVHSLYTHPEIFLRELVSNASDALSKARFRRLTDQGMHEPEAELKINITVDKENELFAIEDTGIGMNRDDLINQIGTIASSGTLEFLRLMKEEKQNLNGELIGKFGVGFYSVFMVTNDITIDTRSANPEDTGWLWHSIGEERFSIEESDRQSRGTKIYFKLNDEYKEFYEPERVKEVLKKYSNFVDFPVYVNDEAVNQVTALWQRKKDDIKDEEIVEFYKFISGDFEAPLGHLLLSIEGVLNFKALLFIPQTAPPAVFRESNEKSLHLYSSKVFIQDDCKDILPEYLRFIRGVVDTEDLPLNVSRESTQNSPLVTKIRNVLTGKVLSLLEDWVQNDTEKFEKFFKNFGQLFKIGINSDYEHRDRIINLLRFESSAKPALEMTSLKDYVSRMKPQQTEIYYAVGDSREKIEKNPNLEYFRKKEIEVLLLTDPVDVFTIPYVFEYDKKLLKSIEKADISLSADDESAPDTLSPETSRSLIEVFKETLSGEVEDVVESHRLVDSPATLVAGKGGMDRQMEKMMQMFDKNFAGNKRILEINTSHPIIKQLSKLNIADPADPQLRSSIKLIFDCAMLLEEQLHSPADFVARVNETMTKALQNI